MDSSPDGLKRKKRKTRRCLDEIRKRSRAHVGNKANKTSLEIFSKEKTNGKGNHDRNKSVCKITTSRLTLQPTMLSKSIKSETVTRPSTSTVASIPQLNGTTGTVLMGADTKSHCSKTSESTCMSKAVQNEAQRTNGNIAFNVETDSDGKVQNTPGSYILFSSISQALDSNDVVNNSNSCGEPTSPTTSMTTQNSSCPGYSEYAQYMADLPSYLSQEAPSLFRENAILKIKQCLQKVYADSCQQEIDECVVKHVNNGGSSRLNVSKPAIIEDPRAYLQMSMTRGPESESCSSPEGATRSSPSAPRDSPPPPPPSQSPPPRPSSSSSSSPLSIINQTPEYNFYPRKLNC